MDAERLDELITARVVYDKKSSEKKDQKQFNKQFGIR